MNISGQLCERVRRCEAWVYGGSETPVAFPDEHPNCERYWFDFLEFSYATWREMESECVDSFDSGHDETVMLYNPSKLRRFFIRRMLVATNYPVRLERDGDMRLTDASFDAVMAIHPRILRCVVGQIESFDDRIEPDEEKRMAKQCAMLFGKGDSVSSPHPCVVLYCELVSFWEKFGLNYYDLQRLPHGVFANLKRMMKMEGDFRNKETVDSPAAKGRRTVRRMEF